jgi:1,4-dihydroxy-2-naphthoate polyprenyltransferase
MVALNAWRSTLRIRTLPAAATPVVVGMAMAHAVGVLAWAPALAALVGALLIQVGTNLANDYYDHKKGADTPDRAGPRRASASGDLPPARVRNAAYATFAAAAAVGLYLVWVAGWPILLVGVLGILSGIAYTAGPKPLAYVGLGDVFVFVFFGPVAVMGTVYVQAAWHGTDFWVPGIWMPGLFWGLALGALSTAVLVVNNLRDRPTDAAAGKRTLAVRFGDRFARFEWSAALAGAYALAVIGAQRHGDWRFLLPLASLPLAVAPGRLVWGDLSDRRRLNPALGGTARVLLAYGLLASAAML